MPKDNSINKNSDIFEELNDFEEIDEFDELEELDEEVGSEADLISESGTKLIKSLLESESFNCEIKKYLNSPIPAFFMDKYLQILWINNSSCSYLKLKALPEPLGIQKLFFPYLNVIRIKQIKGSIFNPDAGFSWSGKIELSGNDRNTATGNMIILPHYSDSCSSGIPAGYFGLIDDLTEENNYLLRSIFKSLLEASKLKDNDTGNHIERVNQYSLIMAYELYKTKKYPQINMQFVSNIKFLASMHDVGKIGTPDNILNKPAKLSDEEWDIMKEHTINGAFILSSYPDKMAMEIARSHHEKWDGSGYPYGLRETDIPLSARIVAIADVYDALRMKRSYKESFPHDYAAEVLLKNRGKHFDPELIDLFGTLENEFNNIYNKYSD